MPGSPAARCASGPGLPQASRRAVDVSLQSRVTTNDEGAETRVLKPALGATCHFIERERAVVTVLLVMLSSALSAAVAVSCCLGLLKTVLPRTEDSKTNKQGRATEGPKPFKRHMPPSASSVHIPHPPSFHVSAAPDSRWTNHPASSFTLGWTAQPLAGGPSDL